MTMPFIMVLAMGFLFACGIYLMLERSLTRVLLGFILLGNGVNLLIILTAGRGTPPLTDGKDLSTVGMSDPLPQALILTAIVITFAVTAFLLAMIYRSWRLVRADSLQDDTADLQVAITKMIDSEAEASTDYDDTEFGDEAENPITGAVDLDDDGTPRERDTEDDPGPASADDPGPSSTDEDGPTSGDKDGPASADGPGPSSADEDGVTSEDKPDPTSGDKDDGGSAGTGTEENK